MIISDLLDVESWQGDSLKELERRLSQLISPYKEVRDFRVLAIADGVTLDLAEISSHLRNAAQLTYQIRFDGDLFDVRGKVRLSYFRPQREADHAIFHQLMESDAGQGFAQHLQTLPGWKRFSVTKSKTQGWYLDFGSARTLEDFPDF